MTPAMLKSMAAAPTTKKDRSLVVNAMERKCPLFPVGLIMATYFGAIVKSLVNDIIMPPRLCMYCKRITTKIVFGNGTAFATYQEYFKAHYQTFGYSFIKITTT